MGTRLTDIRTTDEIQDLKEEAAEILATASGYDLYEQMEELMYGYGVEMDYVMDILY